MEPSNGRVKNKAEIEVIEVGVTDDEREGPGRSTHQKERASFQKEDKGKSTAHATNTPASTFKQQPTPSAKLGGPGEVVPKDKMKKMKMTSHKTPRRAATLPSPRK